MLSGIVELASNDTIRRINGGALTVQLAQAKEYLSQCLIEIERAKARELELKSQTVLEKESTEIKGTESQG